MRPETGKPVIDVARARALTSKRAWLPTVPPLASRGAIRPGRCPLRGEWLLPDEPSATTILYLHGGGYYFARLRRIAGLSFPLARRQAQRTFSLDYRLAPENPFPAALDDALAAYRQLVSDGAPPASIVIAGDSAGGGLAARHVAGFARCRRSHSPQAPRCSRRGRILAATAHR